MAFPFQCLVAWNKPSGQSGEWTLFGASGSRLVAQSSKGTTSVWPPQDIQTSGNQEEEPQERPGKRIKLSPPQGHSSNFSHLVLSSDGKYLVGVTGEDKCIRVFQVDALNHLQQVSERCMPRRPSSIALTSDDSTILCGDKFGDVYALPLLPGPDDELPSAPAIDPPEQQKIALPAATVLTVHSGRNRKTLEEQLKQKAKAPPKPKEAATFKHDLLLGHVSMLTDLVYAKVGNRSYIITADRDEHIRVSRGQPQAHIIEGFCFGHEEFVSRLCLTQSGLLVSGGGDAELYVWDWQNFQLREKLPLRDTALRHVQSRTELQSMLADAINFKVAVSGIWDVPSANGQVKQFLVACEGLPALFSFTIGDGATAANTIPLNGNVLGVALVRTAQEGSTVVVSIDNVHKPGSTTEGSSHEGIEGLQAFSSQGGDQWCEDGDMQKTLKWFTQQASALPVKHVGGGDAGEDAAGDARGSGTVDDKALRDILYSVENLRKRPGADD